MASESNSVPEVVARVIALIETVEEKERVLRTVAAYFGANTGSAGAPPTRWEHNNETIPPPRTATSFSNDTKPSPKQFLVEKRPSTDIERIACLAYYLTHYRETLQFKTANLTKLNTEAAQVRFSNAALATNNALKRGFLAHGNKGHKQLSALGEQCVQALPDRDAARRIMIEGRRDNGRRRARGTKKVKAE